MIGHDGPMFGRKMLGMGGWVGEMGTHEREMESQAQEVDPQRREVLSPSI
jgi:hypothetical protein